MNFKEGDKVKIIKECSGCIKGKYYILSEYEDGLIANKNTNGRIIDTYDDGCTCEDNWLPLTMIELAKIALTSK